MSVKKKLTDRQIDNRLAKLMLMILDAMPLEEKKKRMWNAPSLSLPSRERLSIMKRIIKEAKEL